VTVPGVGSAYGSVMYRMKINGQDAFCTQVFSKNCGLLLLHMQCRQLSEQKALKHGFSAVMEAHIARYFAG